MPDRPSSRGLRRLVTTLTAATPLTVEQQIILSAQFATWVWLGSTGKLPRNLAPDEQRLNADELSRVFRALRHDHLVGNGDAFISDDSVVHAASPVVLANLLHETRLLIDGGFIGAEFADDVLIALGAGAGRDGLFTLPPELVQLLAGLADIQSDDTVYTPFDDALQLSLAASREGARVFTEISRYSPLPYLINLLSEQAVEIRAGSDPIKQPGYVDGPRLRTFSKTVAFPPMGMRYPIETTERDLYGRFRERTASGSVLAVRHVLSQTEQRAIILSPNTLLFSAGAERALREALVHGGLEAVIALPPATLFATPIPLAVLVVNLRRKAPSAEVLFVNGAAEFFHERDGKGRTTLTGWRELLETVRRRRASDHATLVDANVIEASDYQLMVSRYARSQLTDALDEALNQGETVLLEDLVEFVRPLPVSTAHKADRLSVEALEVGVADLPEYGYIRSPQKKVHLPELKNELRPFDILITVKGSVGKVGIVPPDVPKAWVAGQSCLILRMRQGRNGRTNHTPLSLFLYLRSDLGKTCLARIASGSTVPLIQLRELRKLPVVLPTAETQAAAEDGFNKLVSLQQSIDDLRAAQEELSATFWPLQAPALLK